LTRLGSDPLPTNVQALVQTLSPIQQYLHQKRIELRSGSLLEQITAMKGMGEFWNVRRILCDTTDKLVSRKRTS
jgi:hypothetical protein